VLNVGGDPTLNTVAEDATNPTGTLVSVFANTLITDVDAAALKGIAVTGLTEKLQGTWQFSTDGGATWVALGSPSDTAARVLVQSNRVRFVPAPNYSGTPQLFFRAWDQTNHLDAGTVADTTGQRGGSGAFSTASTSASLTVTPVNDAPVLTLSGTTSYVRNAPAIVLAPNALVTDVDSANFNTGELRVRITLGGGTNNTLAIGGGFTVDGGNNVRLDGIAIGTRTSSGVGTNELRVTFNANATKAIVQQLVRAITYRNVGGSAGTRTIAFTVSDGDSGLSGECFKTVNVA
jgi:hypothetical protein